MEIKSELGTAYRALQIYLVELWKEYEAEEISISEAEAKHILEGVKRINKLSNSIYTIADALLKTHGAKPKLEVPPEIGSLEEKVAHDAEMDLAELVK